MTSLPPLLLRAPRIFYAAAVIVFLASFALTYAEISTTMAYAPAAAAKLALLRGLYQAALEALYIAANGVLAHILIAIWQDGAVRRDRGGDS